MRRTWRWSSLFAYTTVLAWVAGFIGVSGRPVAGLWIGWVWGLDTLGLDRLARGRSDRRGRESGRVGRSLGRYERRSRGSREAETGEDPGGDEGEGNPDDNSRAQRAT